MKKLFLIAVFAFSCLITFANNKNEQKIKNNKNRIVNDEYFFLLMGDGCFHLVHLFPPGHIGPNGEYYEYEWSLETVSSENYTGTVQICPSEGTAYC